MKVAANLSSNGMLCWETCQFCSDVSTCSFATLSIIFSDLKSRLCSLCEDKLICKKIQKTSFHTKPSPPSSTKNHFQVPTNTASQLQFVLESQAMGEVDPAFVQAIDQRPKLKPTILVDDEIPIIDLSVLSSSHGDTKKLVSEIGHASQKWGFFQVVNHGVPLELFERMQEVGKRFFELPLEEKKKVKRDMVNALGYHDGEHTKNVRDWKEVFDFLVEDMTMVPASHEPDDKELRILTNQWPQNPPQFREVCQEYARGVEKLAYKLLGLIALSLGQPENKFNDFFKDHQTSLIRFNHYLPCPFPHLALGVGRHKDAGALTVLAQDDAGGLEVRRKSDGEWIPVTPTPNAFIINVGDMVQVWSNDKYESVEHRVVVNTEKERFSIPFFFFPAHHVMVKPLEELLTDDNPAKYKEYNWGKFSLPETAVISRNRMWRISKLIISGYHSRC